MTRSDVVRRFTDLEVWQASHQLFLDVWRDLEPCCQRKSTASLVDQVTRSIASIGANIAEGFNRSKPKYLNSLQIALGEANETENWLYKLRDLELINRDTANERIRETIKIEKMLTNLIRSISQTPKHPK